MTLTVGTAPFGSAPAGRFIVDPRAPDHVLHVAPSPRRVRVLLGGEAVADSTRAQLLEPPGQTAMYLFPRDDVRTDLPHPSERAATAAALGEATFWTVRTGDAVVRDGDREDGDVVWSYACPMHEAEAVEDLLCLLTERLELAVDPPVRG